jgi:hypothetical protein
MNRQLKEEKQMSRKQPQPMPEGMSKPPAPPKKYWSSPTDEEKVQWVVKVYSKVERP